MAVESPPFIIYRWVFLIKTPFIVGFTLPRLITRVTRGYSWTKKQQNGGIFQAAIFSELEPCNRPPARRHGHPPVPGRCLHHRWHCLGFIFGWAKLTSLTFLDDIYVYIYIYHIYISDILQWWSSNHPPELENLGAACEFRIRCFSIATSEVVTPRRSFLQARQVAKVRGVQGALGLDPNQQVPQVPQIP